jgi:hypothetical protein
MKAAMSSSMFVNTNMRPTVTGVDKAAIYQTATDALPISGISILSAPPSEEPAVDLTSA